MTIDVPLPNCRRQGLAPRRLGGPDGKAVLQQAAFLEAASAICGGVGWRFAGQMIANGDDGIARDGGISWLSDGGGDSPLAARGRKTRRSRRMAKTENVLKRRKCVSGSIFSPVAYRISTHGRVPGFCSAENLAGAGRKRRPRGAGKGLLCWRTENGGELQKPVGQGALRLEQKSLPGESGRLLDYWLVRATGFEPVTSTV